MLTIEAETESRLFHRAIQYAEARGAKVQKPAVPARWLTPKQLGQETGLKATALFKRLRSPNCPAHESEKGQRRTLRILAHERLIEWLRQPLQPGRRL